MKIFKKLMAVLCALVLTPCVCTRAEVNDDEPYVYQYLKLYGNSESVKPEDVSKLNLISEPEEVECGLVRVILRELVYDGVWMYSAAEISIDDENAMIVPGSADLGDPVCGVNDEGQIEDDRPFREVAKEDGKVIYYVNAYPEEFHGERFIDYFQLKDSSVYLSGARMNTGNEPIAISWKIRVKKTDPAKENEEVVFETQTESVEYVLEIKIETGYYYSAELGVDDRVVLIVTPLATYTSFEKTENYLKDVALKDAYGETLPQGLSVEALTYDVLDLSETILIGGGTQGNIELTRESE